MGSKRLRKGLVILIVFAMLFAMGVVNLSTAQALPGSEDTAFSSANEKVDVLIGFYHAPGSSERNLVRSHGGEIYREFTIVDVIAASMTQQAADALAQNPKVRYVEPDGPVYAIGQTVPWGIDRVFGTESHPFATWSTTKGGGISVAILDTGIDETHEDLPILLGGVNTVDNTHWGSDGNSHGTHVAGTVAALDNTLGVVGVGPELGLYAVKVLDDSGSGSWSSVAAGVEWAVKNKIKVLNMSLGGDDSQTMRDACDAAYSAGHLLVAAAGNSGNPAGRGDNVGYPAAYDSVIAVAASTSNDNRASFSSTGPAVELIAPGSSILSTIPGNKYETKSGTSMASPHVAGAAALAWAANISLTNVQIREILRDTVEDLGLSANHQGYGLVRADAAVRAAKALNPPATGNIEGTVKDDANVAIGGATVAVEGTTLSATTDGNGNYLLNDVPTGERQVTASAEGFYSQTVTVTVLENTTVTQNFTLQAIPTYAVSGKVTDTGDSPLEGATVTIEGTEPATTGSDGGYLISGVEEGIYSITASKDGYSSVTQTVTVNSNTTVNFVLEVVIAEGLVRVASITYSPNGGRLNDRHLDITLLLLDDQNNPVSNASVSATLNRNDGSSWNYQGTTGSGGTVTFSLNNHGSGIYDTIVTAVGAEGLVWDGVTPPNSYTKK